ncbi:hypothetical protein CPC08DRAFT_823151 [Agrocybe pediades]|nr:hypothetical protein CPC08DRAFT_823151 [Agrocybe pediades]
MTEHNALNLDDISKTAFCIPFDSTDDGIAKPQLPSVTVNEARDIENGGELRFLAYKKAWTKCLARMQEIVQELQAASMKAVVQETRSSYDNTLPGLPYPELPVVSVTNPTFGSTFLGHITSALEENRNDAPGPSCLVTHVYPSDFSNISNGMKAIVSGFIEKSGLLEKVKRKTAESLANYDIKFLGAWYKAWLESSDIPEGRLPNLVVVFHDFEQYDPLVMRDICHICSKSISQLPLVFLLSLSSPSTNYLNVTYPQSTLALLRVRNFTTPSGLSVLQEIILKTFFDFNFEPDILIGPGVLDYLHDLFTRYASSVDVIFTVIQLVHLRHFSLEPLTVLVRDTPSLATSSPFTSALCARVSLQTHDEDVDMDPDPVSHAIAQLDKYRNCFYSRYQDLRLGFCVMLCVHRYLERQGHASLKWFTTDTRNEDRLQRVINGLLSGTLEKDVETLGIASSKLKEEEARDLIEEVHAFLYDLPADISSQEQGPRAKLIMMKNYIATDTTSESSTLSMTLSTWLVDYLCEKLSAVEELDLWELWYTGRTPFPSELLNPSIRASMVSGLLRPYDYAEDPSSMVPTEPSPDKAIWELPDTSILFKRYLDSGKMINVYDWFESFKYVLDTQRSQTRELRTASPKKRAKGKAAKRQEVQMTEEEEEQWNVQVQARFIRAMHELDYLGFIKHTGRKADHLLRTVFDINDAE